MWVDLVRWIKGHAGEGLSVAKSTAYAKHVVLKPVITNKQDDVIAQ